MNATAPLHTTPVLVRDDCDYTAQRRERLLIASPISSPEWVSLVPTPSSRKTALPDRAGGTISTGADPR